MRISPSFRYGLLIVLALTRYCYSYTFNCSLINGPTADDDFSIIYAAFPTLNNSIDPLSGSPWLGYQNFTYCCSLAVKYYLSHGCVNDTEVQVDARILSSDTQFPCGATFIGDPRGAPTVQASYSWAAAKCPGWQISEASNSNQWLLMLVGFLLPSVVFSLNIPRGQKLPLRESLFRPGMGWITMPYALLAVCSAVLDTVIWLCIVFMMAAPLLLSGVFEALLDYKILRYLLRVEATENNLPLALRARLLFTVLGGNLEPSKAWKHVMGLAGYLDEFDNPDFRNEQDLFSGSYVIEGKEIADDKIEMKSETLIKSKFEAIVDRTVDSLEAHSKGNGTHKLERHDDSVTTVDFFHRGLEGSSHARTLQSFPPQSSTTSPYHSTQGPASLAGSSASNIGSSIRDTGRTMHGTNGTSSHSRIREAISKAISQAVTEARDQAVTEAIALAVHEDREKRRREDRKEQAVAMIEIRLKSMLGCQYDFGTTVGCPLVFYVGSFIYALVEILPTYGNNDVGHALAFGMWWMIIPHVATISSLLLGGNNPNTLSAITGPAGRDNRVQYAFGFAKPNSPTAVESEKNLHVLETYLDERSSGQHHTLLEPIKSRLDDVYGSSIYMPVAMWDRGRNKQDWLFFLCGDTWTAYEWDEDVNKRVRGDILDLIRMTIMLSFTEWMLVIFAAFILLFIPCTLGFLTAYWTPQVGLSCRSLTLMLYITAQIAWVVMWLMQMTIGSEYWRQGRQIRSLQTHVDDESAINQLSTVFTNLQGIGRRDSVSGKSRTSFHPAVKAVWYLLLVVALTLALFTSLVGTILQLIGVYRNCLCHLNVTQWSSRYDPSSTVTLSTNNRRDIVSAINYWQSIGLVSICFLALTCFGGWWYQNRARATFNIATENLGQAIERRREELIDAGKL